MKKFITQPDTDNRLGDELLRQLSDQTWTSARAAVAFVKASGVKHLRDALVAFAKRADLQLSIGIDMCGTTYEGLLTLMESVGIAATIRIFHNENPSTFHPKVWLFRNSDYARLDAVEFVAWLAALGTDRTVFLRRVDALLK